MAKLGPQHDIFIFCCTVQFDKMPWQDMFRLTKNFWDGAEAGNTLTYPLNPHHTQGRRFHPQGCTIMLIDVVGTYVGLP